MFFYLTTEKAEIYTVFKEISFVLSVDAPTALRLEDIS